MEQTDFKLNSSNPVVVAQFFSKLLVLIKDTYKNADKNKNNSDHIKELTYLKEKCYSEEYYVNITANKSLIQLVEDDILPVTSTFFELISAVPNTKCHAGVLSSIIELLLIDLQKQLVSTSIYNCPFALSYPQHPLITILAHNSHLWHDIFIKMKKFHKNNERFRSYSYEVFKPLHLYILCNPNNSTFESFQLELCNFLIHNDDLHIKQLSEILGWIPVSSKTNVFIINTFLIKLIDFKLQKNELNLVEPLSLCLTSTLYIMIYNRFDPCEAISCLKQVITNYADKLTISDCLLIILSDCITICPLTFLQELLNLCATLIELKLVNLFTLYSIKGPLLYWISGTCFLTKNIENIAKHILKLISNYNPNTSYIKYKNDNVLLTVLKNTNEKIYVVYELYIQEEFFVNNSSSILTWLKKLHKMQSSFLKSVFNFVSSIFLMNFNDTNITKEALRVLENCVKDDRNLSNSLLTMILYKLSNTKSSILHFNLIKALSKTVKYKDNLPLVLSTLKALENGPGNLKMFSLTLYYDLWNVDHTCFSHLERLLIMEYDDECNKFEFYLTKAYILKQICVKRPEQYGRELVVHLSKIFNECIDDECALPCAIAIDAITLLCKADIVDIKTVWTTLAPRFCSIQQIPIIVSLCAFMSKISLLPVELYSNLIDEVVSKLWEYATLNESDEVINAALKALSHFSLEKISTRLLQDPEYSLLKEKISENYCFIKVPGTVWITMLQNNIHTSLWGDFLIKLVSSEISSLTKDKYNVRENQREPFSYKYLPEHSIVGAIGNYLKANIEKWHKYDYKNTYVECLRIFSKEFSKPLPPFDWSFLQELVHDKDTRFYCITIASHQLIFSGTALRFMENFITAVTQSCDNVEDILMLYKNLKYLCNSIQPMILKPFFEKTLDYAINQVNMNTENTLFTSIMLHLKNAILNENVHEVNKSVINQLIGDVIANYGDRFMEYEDFIKCVCVLPKKSVDEVCSLKSVVNLTQYQTCVKIKFLVTLNTNIAPLESINDLIEIKNSAYLERYSGRLISYILQVFQKHRNSLNCPLWLLELLGKLQAVIASNPEEKFEIQFLYKVFMIAVIIISGNDIFINEHTENLIEESIHRLFPQSVACLIKTEQWITCSAEMLKWLYYVIHSDCIPNQYKVTFSYSLMALRYTEEFKSNLQWMKYISGKLLL